MEDSFFTLNNRFVIKPALGLIRDIQTGQETRIEPRLMSLLSLLAENNERLVSRPVITKQIWDDYGNADEGLTQAISYLRQVLDDESKLLIETIPKKGYVLHARVFYDDGGKELKYVHGENRGKYILIAAVVFILAMAAFLIIRSRQSKPQFTPDIAPAIHKPISPDSTGINGNPNKLPDTTTKAQQGADKVKR
jgi:DNA-binding winged helix-turn-helix (wHTH) protein